jgi:predicted RNase H-like HicB family nuclease
MSKTLTYTLSIESHPDEGGYLAHFPALPCCHSWGDTYEEAVKNADEALIGYLEIVTTVPMHPGDIKRPLLKKIIQDAGLTEAEFHALL